MSTERNRELHRHTAVPADRAPFPDPHGPLQRWYANCMGAERTY
ncbi:MAG: hypothetical protein ACYSXF_06275 [Planctomycetota bacterium]